MFQAVGPLQLVLVLALAIAPLVIAIWVAVQIAGIRQALERVARAVESRAGRSAPM